MDGQSRTCIEWMCNDEYDSGSFDLTNIMSPPDHESVFHSLLNATPLGEEFRSGTSPRPRSPSFGPLACAAGLRAASEPPPAAPAAGAGVSLVSLVKQLDLTAEPAAAQEPAAATAAPPAGSGGGAPALTVSGPSLAQAVSEALSGLSGGPADGGGGGGGGGLTRVTSASQLSALEGPPTPPPAGFRRERRPSVSCPSSPPTRRAAHAFFTESVFDPERPGAICRAWREQQAATAADGAGAGAAAGAGLGAGAAAGLGAGAAAAAGKTPPVEAPRKAVRMKPRPSRLRELNFMAPTSM